MANGTLLERYPALTSERLSIVATVIRTARTQTVALHDPAGGDSEWSLGCRNYSRTCHALCQLATKYAWFAVLPELEGLSFSFAIGNVPFRFYRGAPEDPPGRYLIRSAGELHHVQRSFEMEGLHRVDRTLRLAVEVNETREVSAVTLVEMDEVGNVTDTETIALYAAVLSVVPPQAKPISLPPPIVEPLDEQATPIRKLAATEKKIG